MIPISVQIDLTLEENLPPLLSEQNLGQLMSRLPPKVRVTIPKGTATRTGLQPHRLKDLQSLVLTAYSAPTNGQSETIGHRYSYNSLECLTKFHRFKYYVAPRDTHIFEKNAEYEICMLCWKVVPLGRKVI
jgi:hypothetical protein